MRGIFKVMLWVACACAVAACSGSNNKETQVIAEMTRDMRTDCIGRMLIDVPKSFEWSHAPFLTLYYGKDADFSTVDVQVIGAQVTPEQFKARVDKRAAQIAADTNQESHVSMLLSDENDGADIRIFKRYRNNEISRSHTYEVHLLVSGVQAFLKADSFPEDGDTILPRLKRLATQITKPDAQLKQWGPGLCLGPVLINADHDYEVLDVPGRDKSPEHRDLVLEFYSSSMEKPGRESLLERTGMVQGMFGNAMTNLRKGHVSALGVSAEEVLAKLDEADNRHSLTFGLWALQPEPSLLKPSITLEMRTGDRIPALSTTDLMEYDPAGLSSSTEGEPIDVDSSLTDQEAIALWDAIVKSIRPRSGSVRR